MLKLFSYCLVFSILFWTGVVFLVGWLSPSMWPHMSKAPTWAVLALIGFMLGMTTTGIFIGLWPEPNHRSDC